MLELTLTNNIHETGVDYKLSQKGLDDAELQFNLADFATFKVTKLD